MKAHLLLADSAQADGAGKIGALGLGWSVTGRPTPAHAVVVLLRVGWNETNQPHTMELTLLTADGEHAVVASGPLGEQPLKLDGSGPAGARTHLGYDREDHEWPGGRVG